MAEEPTHKCPFCGQVAHVTRKWVKNKSGKRYNYLVYHHNGNAHWLNRDHVQKQKARKGELQNNMLRLLNSVRFNQAIFTVNDIVNALKSVGFQHSKNQVRESLIKLADRGMLKTARRGKHIHFINTTNLVNPNYVVKRVDISLEDIELDDTFKKHNFKFEVCNDREFPLQYVQFRAAGDISLDKDKISFKAYDVSKGSGTRIYFILDDPREKKVLIEFSSPIMPEENRKIELEYLWPEPYLFHAFTVPSSLRSLKFSLISKKKELLQVLRTNSARTEAVDDSDRVAYTHKKDGDFIESFETKDPPKYAVLKFKWKELSKQKFAVSKAETSAGTDLE